jgi:hypothetical protein
VANFEISFDTPGVRFALYDGQAETQAALDAASVSSCTDEAIEPYQGTEFFGISRHQTGCGSTSSEYYTLVLTNTAAPSQVAILEVGVAAGDTATATNIFNSFGLVGDSQTPDQPLPDTTTTAPELSTAPEQTKPPQPTVPSQTTIAPEAVAETTTTAAPEAVVESTTTAPAQSPQPEATTLPVATVAGGNTASFPATNPVLVPDGTLPVAPDAVDTYDETGQIFLKLPAAWTSTSLAPSDNNGTPIPMIAASTDLAQLMPPQGTTNTFSVSGVVYSAMPFSENPTVDYPYSMPSCTDAGVEAYDDSMFAGELHHYTNCGGTNTRIFTLHASTKTNTVTAVVLVQIAEDNNDALNTILGSFNITKGSFGS